MTVVMALYMVVWLSDSSLYNNDGCSSLFSVFFFKQKTAYEMRISDWSSDVCSSDLLLVAIGPGSHFLGCAHTRANFESAFWRSGTADSSEERRVGKECVSTCRSR